MSGRSVSTWIAAGVLALVVMFVLAAPFLANWSAEETDWSALETPPGASHWFGTDVVGRDLFARIAEGGRLSMGAAILATGVSLLIGIPYGAIAGFSGGRTDQVMMRIVDTLYALPFVLLVILLLVVVGRHTMVLFACLGAVFWLDIARIVRGQTLRIREAPYIVAARGLGARTSYLLMRHVLPNVMPHAVVYATLTVPGVILAEAFLSFLGLGVQEPDTSWGVLIADGTENMRSAPWILLFPASFLAATVWSLNMLGDRVRDVMDSDQRSTL